MERPNKCKACSCNIRSPIPSRGAIPANIMVIGDKPSPSDARHNSCFAGKAGYYLDKLLETGGVSLDTVYYTHLHKCTTPDNKAPKKRDLGFCMSDFKKELSHINPKFILLCGAPTAQAFLGQPVKVSDYHGRLFKHEGRICMVVYSPAIALIKDQRRKTQELNNDIGRFCRAVLHGGIPREMGLNLTVVNSPKQLDHMLKILDESTCRVSLDIETTSLSPWSGDIISLGLGLNNGEFVIPITHSEGYWAQRPQEIESMMERIGKVLSTKKIIAHNGKFDLLWCQVKYKWRLYLAHDTMMMSYMLDENTPNGLKYLATALLGAPEYDIPLSKKQGEVQLGVLAEYNALDVYYTRQLCNLFMKQIKEDPALKRFYHQVIMPAVRAFIDIEFHGVYLDVSQLETVNCYISKQLAEVQSKLERRKPGVNWSSPKQVAEFLFKDLGLNPLEYTASGSYSTSESVLQRLATRSDAVRDLLEYRRLSKMMSGFISSWQKKVIDSRLHPSFKLHGTVTGRLSCSEPNLQQVPRDPQLRSLISAPQGWTLVEADFSQVELRVAAMLSGDKAMLNAFNTGEDIHTKTAVMISGMDPHKLTGFELKEWRKKAKAINFGFLYGMGARKFQEYARDKYGIDFTEDESRKIRDKYFATYSGLPKWYERQYRVARLNGYIRNPAGRLRRLPDIKSPHNDLRAAAERQAINSAVQGFASDLTLMSLVEVHNTFPHDELHVIGSVHDAILFEVRNDKLLDYVPRVKTIMENPTILATLGVKLTVPIRADISIGNWGNGKSLEETKRLLEGKLAAV